MEIFVRILVWILNRTYRRQGASLYGASPMDEHVLQEYETTRQAERNAERQQQVVAAFQSAAAPVQGAVEYDEIKWESLTRVVETPAEFTFYSEGNIVKVIAKSQFTRPREAATLRRVIRRRVAESDLLDD
jgi:hypothetical protein